MRVKNYLMHLQNVQVILGLFFEYEIEKKYPIFISSSHIHHTQQFLYNYISIHFMSLLKLVNPTREF